MTPAQKTGLRRLGVIPLLIPVVFSSVLFLVATQGFNLPARNWAILAVGYCALVYLFLWLVMRRRAAIERAVGALEAPHSERPSAWRSGLARVLRSPGGLLSVALGAWLLWRGDRERAALFFGVGMLFLTLSPPIKRRMIELVKSIAARGRTNRDL